MQHHASILGVSLGLAVLALIGCAFGLITPLHSLALAVGIVLFTAMACGLFFATLHLQKIR